MTDFIIFYFKNLNFESDSDVKKTENKQLAKEVQ